MDTLAAMRLFTRVMETESFSEAARQLGLAPSSVSRRIGGLEDELGVRLLDRHSRGVTPTEAGLVLREHAAIILRQIERAKGQLIDITGPPRGKIALGVTPTVNLVLAADLVMKCRAELPEVSLSIVEGMSETLMEWVESDRLDLAFSYNPTAVRGLVCEPLVTEDLCLVAPGDDDRDLADPVPFAELAKLPLILPSMAHGLRILIDETANKQNRELDVILEIDSVPATKELVEQAVGYTVLAFGAVRREVGEGRLRAHPITRPRLARDLYLAYAANHPTSRASVAVGQIIRSLVKEGEMRGAWSSRPPG
ncbi:MAG: LysR family transcriptional regulator [Proteobacteria bacterium]|nr:LysR family transcriptional regulator [Pseudomonadota bacterium]